MTQKNNILQELQELNSPLAGQSRQNVYSVPAGYFEGLAAQLLGRVKALEAAGAAEELFCLSPLVSDISRKAPYTVPAGYFENLASLLLIRIKAMQAETAGEELDILSPALSNLSRQMPYTVPAGYFDNLSLDHITPEQAPSAKEELESLSPLLSSLKKEMPYTVPEGYFEQVAERPAASEARTRVIAFTSRKWFRYAAAAVVTGLIVLAGYLTLGRNDSSEGQSFAKYKKQLNKEIKKMSDKELDDFIQYTDAGLDGSENAKAAVSDDVKDLLKDVPENELKEFLEETSDGEPDVSETSMMN